MPCAALRTQGFNGKPTANRQLTGRTRRLLRHRFGPSSRRASEGLDFRNAVFPSTGDLSFTFKPQTFMEHIAEVLSGLGELTMQHRMVAEGAKWVSSGSAMTVHLEALEGRFKRLLARTIRQRNAIVHGARAVPQVIATCEPFIRELCAQVVAQALTASAKGEDPIDRLESARGAWLRQRTALREGKQPASVVFAGPLTGD